MAAPPIAENKTAERLLAIARNLLPQPVLRSLRPFYHFLLALAAALLYRFPSRHLTVIGITGTKGKTTTVELLGAILRKAGKPTATLSGLQYTIGDDSWPNTFKMTLPGRLKLQKFLREAVNRGAQFAVLEITSEGIAQHRHRFIRFNVAALTNLQKEHIEAHGSFEAYRRAKGELFRAAKKIHVINADDPSAEYFAQFPAEEKIYYSRSDAKRFDLAIRIPGEFNLMNAICAATIAEALGIPAGTISNAIAEFEGVPGRMQFVQKEPFAVVVDYAHTPDSLEAVYKTLKSLYPTLICVLGAAGGGRDKWKRPVMGAIAAKYCNEIILTNEDPYDEDPNRIVADIQSGIPDDQSPITKVVLDRKEAIREAISTAKLGDAVVITGKGAERFMVVRNKKIPWSDVQIVQNCLEELHNT